jgi:diacylglycerol kinase (ATP)
VRVIANPRAGRGRGRDGVERVRLALASASIPCAFQVTDGPGHAIELAERAVEHGFRAVCAVGGDGTVSEVVNGLARATPPGESVGPLIAFPTGSGNDFAATTGSPGDVKSLLRVIDQPRRYELDLACTQLHSPSGDSTRFFDNTLGIGFEARVNRESERIHRLRGTLLYLTAALRALRDPGAPYLDITWQAEGGSSETVSGNFLMVTAGNGPRSGGGFYLTPDACHDSGTLELGFVKAIPRRRILRLLPKTLKGSHTSHPAVRIVRCRGFSIRSREPLPIHADGEYLGGDYSSLEVSIEAGRLHLLI